MRDHRRRRVGRRPCRPEKALKGEEKQLVTHPQMMRVMKLMETLMKSADPNEVIHTRI